MKTTRLISIFVFVLALVLMTSSVMAKDLKGNLGVGFNSQFSPHGVDSISGKYWIGDKLAVQGLIGFNYSDSRDENDLGAKVYYKIKDEENLHADAFCGLGFAHVNPDPGDAETAIWLSFGGGIEYFFSGLPNLGFSTEVGLTLMDYDDDTSFGTNADSFIGAGIHYYFDLMSPTVKKPAKAE
jgi:hypothetical protein